MSALAVSVVIADVAVLMVSVIGRWLLGGYDEEAES